MKKIFSLFFLLMLLDTTVVFAGIPIDKTNFPNASFRSLLTSKFDLDKNGFFTPDEISAIMSIDCNKDTSITDVTGIELFPELKELSCWMCPLKKLDVSKNTNLDYLDCCETGIKTLNLLSNPNLKQVWAYGNQITSLDLRNCKFLVKAVNNGIYNNDKNEGKSCSYADEATSSYLVVDKNIKLILSASKTVISGGGGSGGSGDSDSGGNSDSGSYTDPNGDEQIAEGIGGLASPAHKSSYKRGTAVAIDIRPTGSVGLGGISISGTVKITLNGVTKYSKSISTSGTAGQVKDSFTPASAGTYRITVDLVYKLSGVQIQYSRYSNIFYVTAPACKTHTYGKWTTTKKATYTTTGTKQRVCSVCGHVEKATIAKLKVTAGAVLTSSNASYKVLKGLKTVAYVAPLKKNLTVITIPAAVTLAGKSYKVTSVTAKAFSGCSKLTKVTIGNNVTTIGANAFAGCKKLATVSIGKGVTTIGQKAFYNCSALKTIKILTSKLTTIRANAFKAINANAAISVPAAKKVLYKKLLKSAGIGAGVKVS